VSVYGAAVIQSQRIPTLVCSSPSIASDEHKTLPHDMMPIFIILELPVSLIESIALGTHMAKKEK